MPSNHVELLAPAGKWDVLEKVVEAGADAVYLGSKHFNMRMLRRDYNFSEQELEEAVSFLHGKKKKLYVTINNLYFDQEIKRLKSYLKFLQEIGVDALIVQDMGVVSLCQSLGLDIPVHASVQMGIGSSQAVKFLQESGLSRVILSKNVSLEEIKSIHANTDVGIEYFVHGDLCTAHTGQCYLSSFACGESSNRGRCIKPCRWQYSLKGAGSEESLPGYFLAHNDLCLYPYLKELIEAGVISFKIEGRMRDALYLSRLISIYRQALDRIYTDPSGYKVDEEESRNLYEHRIRNFTTGSLFNAPSAESIDTTGEREPFFPSTPLVLGKLRPEDYREEKPTRVASPELSVKVGDLSSFIAMCGKEVDTVIIGWESFRQIPGGWNQNSIQEALELADSGGPKVMLETPRIVTEKDNHLFNQICRMKNLSHLCGLIVNDYGSLRIAKQTGLPLWAGYGLNITNSSAAQFIQQQGVSRIIASQELAAEELKHLVQSGLELEVMVHGPLCGMITDLCLARAQNQEEQENCSVSCANLEYSLYDKIGQQYKILTDTSCRNYIFYPYDLCLFPYLPQLIAAGLKYLRIDGQYYDAALITEIISIYKNAVNQLGKGIWEQQEKYFRLLNLFPLGLTASPVINCLADKF